MITEYEIGQRPSRPLTMYIRDDRDQSVDLTTYGTISLEVLGSDNEVLDLTGVTLFTEGARNGVVAVIWPKDRSLFEKRGEYLVRLRLENSDGARDYTRTHTLRVREFGRFD